METTRQQKIAKQIQKDMADIFQKEGATLVRGTLVTVTGVRVSPDFSYAKIYVSVFPFEQSAMMMERLEHQNRRDHIQRSHKAHQEKEVGKSVQLCPPPCHYIGRKGSSRSRDQDCKHGYDQAVEKCLKDIHGFHDLRIIPEYPFRGK